MRPLSIMKKDEGVEEIENAQVIAFPLEPFATSSGTPDETQDDAPPDGGLTAWTCCGAVSLINGFTWGVAAVGFLTFRHIRTLISLLTLLFIM